MNNKYNYLNDFFPNKVYKRYSSDGDYCSYYDDNNNEFYREWSNGDKVWYDGDVIIHIKTSTGLEWDEYADDNDNDLHKRYSFFYDDVWFDDFGFLAYTRWHEDVNEIINDKYDCFAFISDEYETVEDVFFGDEFEDERTTDEDFLDYDDEELVDNEELEEKEETRIYYYDVDEEDLEDNDENDEEEPSFSNYDSVLYSNNYDFLTNYYKTINTNSSSNQHDVVKKTKKQHLSKNNDIPIDKGKDNQNEKKREDLIADKQSIGCKKDIDNSEVQYENGKVIYQGKSTDVSNNLSTKMRSLSVSGGMSGFVGKGGPSVFGGASAQIRNRPNRAFFWKPP